MSLELAARRVWFYLTININFDHRGESGSSQSENWWLTTKTLLKLSVYSGSFDWFFFWVQPWETSYSRAPSDGDSHSLAIRRMCMNQASHSSSLGAWDGRRHNDWYPPVSSLCQMESKVVRRALAPVAHRWLIYCHIIMICILTFLMHQCGGLWCCCYLSFYLDNPLASDLCSSKQQRA